MSIDSLPPIKKLKYVKEPTKSSSESGLKNNDSGTSSEMESNQDDSESSSAEEKAIKHKRKSDKKSKKSAKVVKEKANVKEDKSKVVVKAKAKRKIDSTESVSAAKKAKVDKSVKRKKEDMRLVKSEKSSELSHKHRKDSATKVEPSKGETLTEPLEVDIDNLHTVSTAKCVSVDIDQFNSLIDFVRYVK